MRTLTILYSVATVILLCWIGHGYGFVRGLLTAGFFGLPAYVAWKMTSSKRPTAWREYLYFVLVTMVAVGGTKFLVDKWDGADVRQKVTFDRQYRAFQYHVRNMPEFKDVDLSHTYGFQGHVTLQGTVATKDSHDRLVEILERMVKCSRNVDKLQYPGELVDAGPPID